jgi:hypothetical protein
MPRKTFTAGEVLAAADVNTFLMDQSVMTFADSTARGSAIPSPTEGMVTYLNDTDALEVFNGTAYATVGAGIRNPVDTTNTAAGTDALNPSTTGTANTAFGRDALEVNTTGNNNTAYGFEGLALNTTGTANTALGRRALAANTTANGNVAVGKDALLAMQTGSDNVAIGTDAMATSTASAFNVAVGKACNLSMTTGAENVAVGTFAQFSITTGINNTSVGNSANSNNTTGSNNLVLGYNAQPSTTTVSNQITLGNNAITGLRCNVTSISSLSDGRDKSNVKDSDLGLDLVNKLRPVTFDWDRRDGSMSGIKDVGFIAQEVIEVEDDLEIFDTLKMSLRDNEDKYEVAPARLIPVLTKAIQELSKQNENLIARLEKLENK